MDMEQAPPSVPKMAWVEEEEAAATSAQQPQELEQVQLLQEGEWQSWAAGLVPAASLAPCQAMPWDMPLGSSEEALGLKPLAAILHPWAIPGLSLPGNAGLGCALRPLLHSLIPGSSHSLSGAAMDWTQEQEPARGRFRRTAQVLQPSPPGLGPLSLLSPAACLEHSVHSPSLAALLLQMIWEFITCIRQEETTGVGTGLFSAETSAAMLDLLVQKGVSNPKQVSSLWPGLDQPSNCVAPQAGSAAFPQPLRPSPMGWEEGKHFAGDSGEAAALAALQVSPCLLQVPAMVRYIHKWLTANESAGHRLDKALVELTKQYPWDVLMTLLRWAPSGDRYGSPTCLEALGFPGPLPCRACPWKLPDRQTVPGPSGSSVCQCWPVSP